MSYSRSYHERITLHYSGTGRGTCSCGKSVSCSYSGSVSEDINVNINVDTLPFDRSVANCNTSINALTGSVVATKAAQLEAINDSSIKIANSIIDGFYKNIRFEISSQTMELKQRIDANLIHLEELSKRLLAKREQMEIDYQRTANRYLKIFEDLNKELENRIFELNKPAFQFNRFTKSESERTTNNDLVSIVAISGQENGSLQAKLGASITKKRALDAITQINRYIAKQKILQKAIDKSMLKENKDACHYSPICFIETYNEDRKIEKKVYEPNFLSLLDKDFIIDKIEKKEWDNIDSDSKEKIFNYLNSAINSHYVSNDKHSTRVKEMIRKLSSSNSTKCI